MCVYLGAERAVFFQGLGQSEIRNFQSTIHLPMMHIHRDTQCAVRVRETPQQNHRPQHPDSKLNVSHIQTTHSHPPPPPSKEPPRHIRIVATDEDIAGLQVPVHNIMLVQILQTLEELLTEAVSEIGGDGLGLVEQGPGGLVMYTVPL